MEREGRGPRSGGAGGRSAAPASGGQDATTPRRCVGQHPDREMGSKLDVRSVAGAPLSACRARCRSRASRATRRSRRTPTTTARKRAERGRRRRRARRRRPGGDRRRRRASASTVEQRLANGELLYRTKDYDRALVVLSEIIEELPRHRRRTSTRSGSAARRSTRRRSTSRRGATTARSSSAATSRASQPYVGKALARLVDVSLRIDDIAASTRSSRSSNQVPPAQVDAALRYAKGKALLRRRRTTRTRSARSRRSRTGRQYTHQARYFQGLVAMKEARRRRRRRRPRRSAGRARPRRADELQGRRSTRSRSSTDLPPDTDEHRHVIDLAWMAIGRLAYEMEQLQQAAEAYSKVGRDSPEFGTMLYELAWVYVRLGDVQRAERALEVLSDRRSRARRTSPTARSSAPTSCSAPARSTRRSSSTRRPRRVRSDAREGRGVPRSDARRRPSTTTSSRQQQLDVARPERAAPAARDPLGARGRRRPDGVRGHRRRQPVQDADPAELPAHREAQRRPQRRVEPRPRVPRAAGRRGARARPHQPPLEGAPRPRQGPRRRGAGEPRAATSGRSAQQRRQAQGDIGRPARLERRVRRARLRRASQWNTVSQELSRRGVEIDQLKPSINGLRRMLKEDAQRGVARDPDDVKRFNDEIDENERLLKQHRDRGRRCCAGRSRSAARRSASATRATRTTPGARDSSATRSSAKCSSPRRARPAARAQVYAARCIPAARADARRRRPARRGVRASSRRRSAARIGELQAKVDAERAQDHRLQDDSSASSTARRTTSSVRSRSATSCFVRDKLREHRPPRRRRHHRAGVGGPRRGARPRAQPPDRARARGAAPRRGAARGARRRRRRDEGRQSDRVRDGRM